MRHRIAVVEFQAKNEKLTLWSFRKVVNFLYMWSIMQDIKYCYCDWSFRQEEQSGVSGKRCIVTNNCFTLTELMDIRKLPTITRMG